MSHPIDDYCCSYCGESLYLDDWFCDDCGEIAPNYKNDVLVKNVWKERREQKRLPDSAIRKIKQMEGN